VRHDRGLAITAAATAAAEKKITFKTKENEARKI
jgi:hypothetical protein